MSTVPVAFINQLTTGRNAQNNCVPAVLSSGASGLGVRGSAVSTQALLDAEYGTTYTGPTAPWRYTDDTGDTLRRRGLKLETVTDDEPALIARMHTALAAGDPVALAIPSQWGNFDIPVEVRRTQRWPDGRWLSTHFVCVYDETSNGLAAMNPWGAFRHTNDDGHWARLLVLGRVWLLRKASENMTWTADATDATQPSMVDQHGTHVHWGMATFVKAHPNTANARQGSPTNWYAYDGTNAFTLLEDDTVLHYSKTSNDTVQLSGRAGATLSGALRFILDNQEHGPAPDPRLVACGTLVKQLVALAPQLP